MRNLIYIILLLFIFSCDDALFDAGNIVSKSIDISDFNEIYVNDIFEIYLIQDTICGIEAKGGSNLLPNLEFLINENNKLSIYDNNSARWSRDYDKIELFISVDSLRFLQLNAPSKVISQNTILTPELKILSITDFSEIDIDIICGNFYIVNSEPSGGIINISGNTNTFTFWARGSLQVNTENCEAKNITVKTESIGNCYVKASQSLKVEILNSGNIYYSGNPETIEYVNENTENQLIKLD
ncbi:MAG: DUF2807 domain-containing protein [Bacteroidales bacterium]|jgi:hypothetical protein|nr:DUF2807 domain-containing protein [Bacteroidales bacterium]